MNCSSTGCQELVPRKAVHHEGCEVDEHNELDCTRQRAEILHSNLYHKLKFSHWLALADSLQPDLACMVNILPFHSIVIMYRNIQRMSFHTKRKYVFHVINIHPYALSLNFYIVGYLLYWKYNKVVFSNTFYINSGNVAVMETVNQKPTPNPKQ